MGSIGDDLRMDYTAIGETTHLAARLQQHAQPDWVLLSDSVVQLVEGNVTLETVAPLTVKGRDEPLPAHRLLAEDNSAEVVKQKIKADLRLFGLDVARHTPYLLLLLGVKADTEMLTNMSPESATLIHSRRYPGRQRVWLAEALDCLAIKKTAQRFCDYSRNR